MRSSAWVCAGRGTPGTSALLAAHGRGAALLQRSPVARAPLAQRDSGGACAGDGCGGDEEDATRPDPLPEQPYPGGGAPFSVSDLQEASAAATACPTGAVPVGLPPALWQGRPALRSVVQVPIGPAEAPLGALLVGSRTRGAFDSAW